MSRKITPARMVRRSLEFSLCLLGTEWAKGMIRYISYLRDGYEKVKPWSTLSEEERSVTTNSGADLKDFHCPICVTPRDFVESSDGVFGIGEHFIRKKLYSCSSCDFLFTNEDRGSRADYFSDTPYKDDKTGRRYQREVDLVDLGAKLCDLPADASVLVYAVGHCAAVQYLQANRRFNAWGADVADDIEYGDRIINIASQPNYFREMNMKFDVIVAVEVWEHYDWRDVNKAFSWLLEHVADDGVLLGTTSLWYPRPTDPYFKAKHEFGQELLQWWHYPFFQDHCSFYTEDNLRTLLGRHEFSPRFAYFESQECQRSDPGKRIVAVIHNKNKKATARFEFEFNRRFFPVFYS